MQELRVEGLATRNYPEPCVGVRKDAAKRWTGVRAGRAIEPRRLTSAAFLQPVLLLAAATAALIAGVGFLPVLAGQLIGAGVAIATPAGRHAVSTALPHHYSQTTGEAQPG
jgi:hypothetical protein